MSTIQSSSVDRLADRVYTCLSEERDNALDAHSAALPESQRGGRTVHELDMVDFGIVVGVAYGIARGEDPYERADSVRERAAAAATVAYERFGSFDVTYQEDRAARPVPLIYPGPVRRGKPVPWEPIEDVSNGLEQLEPLVGEEDRKRLRAMYAELQEMALRLFAEKRDDGGAVA